VHCADYKILNKIGGVIDFRAKQNEVSTTEVGRKIASLSGHLLREQGSRQGLMVGWCECGNEP
jgi:hypothetical protein